MSDEARQETNGERYTWDPFESAGERLMLWQDAASGLRAVCAIDRLVDGIAAGGIRCWRYPSTEAAVADACRLARAMTLKCALGSLPVGGCKTVVIDHESWDREAGFRVLGQRLAELGSMLRTAGDLGTRVDDLRVVAESHAQVHLNEASLAASVARGLLRCAEICCARRGVALAGATVAVQGAGAIGEAVARALSAAGARVMVSDLDEGRARQLAAELGGEAIAADALLDAEVDLLAPCAIGGVIDEAVAASLRAWAVVGAANNILASPAAGEQLNARGILFVPDVIASAGAVVDGIGESVLGLADRGPLVDRLGDTAGEVLDRAAADDIPPSLAAERVAAERLETLTARSAGPR